MRKGVDDFLWVLLIAFILMGIFYVISPLVPSPGPSEGEMTQLTEFTLGSVGFLGEVPAKDLSLGSFTVGRPVRDTLREFSRMTVETSLFGSSGQKYDIEVPEWYHPTLDKMVLKFSVDSTNMYGNLVVKWNGKEFFSRKASPRLYVIEVGKDYVKEHNTLEIQATGPGLRFWATTVYKLKDVQVDVAYGPAKLYPFELFQNELQAFQRGELGFYSVGSANLNVKINGKSIYSGVPAPGSNTINFSFTDVTLNPGDNILSIESSDGVLEMFNTRFKVYLLTNEIARSKKFEISGENYRLAQLPEIVTKVVYGVNSVGREGVLRIKVNGKTVSSPSPVAGSNTITFSTGELQEGENSIEFSSTGTYDIGTVTVGLEKV